ncbi:MAG: glycosyltransferase family 4 protein [Promethearchaeota archaeon]
MSKLKILLLTVYNYPHPGGISSYITGLKDGLDKLKTKVEIFSANSLPKIINFLIRVLYFLIKLNKNIFYFFYLKTLKFCFEIFIFIKFLKEKWTIINAQDPIALNCTKLIRFFYNPKIFLTVHGFLTAETLVDLGTNNAIIRNLLSNEEQNAYSKALKIIITENSRKTHILKYIDQPKKIFMHKNFVNITKFKKIPSDYLLKKFNLPKNAYVILFHKRLVKSSGVNYFIEAAIDILEKSDKFYFIILGRGYLLKEIKRLIQNRPNILYHEPVPNSSIPYIINSANIVVSPSISLGTVREAKSMVVIEAMACGVPIIATYVGGNIELIESGETGLLIPEKDSKALSEAIINLSQNKNLINEISKKSRKFIVENFSHITASKFLLKFYLSS